MTEATSPASAAAPDDGFEDALADTILTGLEAKTRQSKRAAMKEVPQEVQEMYTKDIDTIFDMLMQMKGGNLSAVYGIGEGITKRVKDILQVCCKCETCDSVNCPCWLMYKKYPLNGGCRSKRGCKCNREKCLLRRIPEDRVIDAAIAVTDADKARGSSLHVQAQLAKQASSVSAFVAALEASATVKKT